MEITWLGHSCFRLRSREAILITDPYDKSLGYNLGKPNGEIVTVSHQHPGHNFLAGVGGVRKVISGPGEYEVANVLITGIATYHDAEGGSKRGKNTVYLIEMEELVVCHLGDLGHIPSSEQIEEMSGVDVLLVPVGGVSTIDAAAAAETISLVEPRVAIPMHYKTEALKRELEPLERFLREMGIKEATAQAKLSISKGSLPHETQLVILDYRR